MPGAILALLIFPTQSSLDSTQARCPHPLRGLCRQPFTDLSGCMKLCAWELTAASGLAPLILLTADIFKTQCFPSTLLPGWWWQVSCAMWQGSKCKHGTQRDWLSCHTHTHTHMQTCEMNLSDLGQGIGDQIPLLGPVPYLLLLILLGSSRDQ